MKSSKIPLWSLPENVQKLIIQQMAPLQLFELSFTSKKTKNLIKTSFKKSNFKVKIYIRQFIAINIFTDLSENFDASIMVVNQKMLTPKSPREMRSLNKRKYSCCYQAPSFIITYWNDILQGAMRICNYFNDLIGLTMEEANCHVKEDEVKDLMNWISKAQLITLVNNGIVSQKTYSFILDSLKTNETVQLCVEPAYSIRKIYPIQFEAKHLKIQFASWLHLEQLLKLNCVSIHLGGVMNMTEICLNKFLKAFLNGSNPNLEYLRVEFKRPINFYFLMKDINYGPNDPTKKRIFKRHGIEMDAQSGYIIKNKKSEESTCLFRETAEGDSIFELLVWKDHIYNPVVPVRILELEEKVLGKIIRFMNPLALFTISQFSRRMSVVIKKHYPSKNNRMDLCISNTFIFSIYSSHTNSFETFETRSVNLQRVYFKRKENGVPCGMKFIEKLMEWNELLAAGIRVYDCLCSLFGVSLAGVSINLNLIGSNWKSALEWINSIEPPVKFMVFGGKKDENYDAAHSFILSNLKTNDCRIEMNASQKFKKGEISADVKHWIFNNGEWIKLKNLMKMKKVITMEISNCSLNDEELNQLIKHIIKGSLPNLEFLMISFERNTFERAVLEGISRRDTVNGHLKKFSRYGWEVTNEDGYEISMSTGETCTICFFDDSVKGTEGFHLTVWKNN